MYSSVGRTWRPAPGERARLTGELVAALGPVAEHAAACGVRLGIEPLNRYETSVVNTVDQGLEMIADLPAEAVGLTLDTYHLNIEEQDPAAAVRRAGAAGRLAHVQVCANDRGAPGADHMDWAGLRDALRCRRLRRPPVHRVVHGRERVDRHRGVDLAPTGPLSGRHRHRRPGVPPLPLVLSRPPRPTPGGRDPHPPPTVRG